MINKDRSATKSSSTKTGSQSLKGKKSAPSKTTPRKPRNSGLKTVVVPEDIPNKEIEFSMTHVKDNPDGSGDYQLRMNTYTQAKLIEMSVVGLLKEHIRQNKKPWYKRLFDFKTKCKGNCAQGRGCDCK